MKTASVHLDAGRQLLALTPAIAIGVCFACGTGWVLGWAIVVTVLAIRLLIGDVLDHRDTPWHERLFRI